MHDPQGEPPGGRRRFLALVGLAGLSSMLGVPGAAGAQTGATPPTPSSAPAAPPAPAAPEISDDARALASIVKRRFGQHLDEPMLAKVTEEIENRLAGGRRLRGVTLANSDEPDSTFRP
jgi:hypothetical protein